MRKAILSVLFLMAFVVPAKAINLDSGYDKGPLNADQVSLNCTAFSKNLSCLDTNVQHALNTLDQLTAGGGSQTPWTSNINAAGYSLSGAGTITANSFVGALTGNATTSTTAGTVTTAAQPSITSLGTLSTLTVSGQTTLAGMTASGNVGIGSTVPAATLEIKKVGTIPMLAVSNATTGDIFTVLNNGYVGIGTTGPTVPLQVNGASYLNGAISAGGTLTMNGGGVNTASYLRYTPNASLAITNTTHSAQIAAINGILNANAAVMPTYNQAGQSSMINTDVLIRRTETNIGTTPGAQLLLDLQNGTTSKFNVSNVGIGYFAGNVGIGTSVPQKALDVEGFVYIGNGNVGLGSSNPVAKLDIEGASGDNLFNVGGTGYYVKIANGTTPSTTMAVNGDVVPLTVKNTNGSSAVGVLSLSVAGSGAHIISTGVNENLRIQPNGTGNITLQPTGAGNVGIGSTVPQQKLDVEGQVYVGNGNIGIGTSNTGGALDVGTGSVCINHVCNATWPSGSSQWTTSGSNIYYNTGNVGINQISPAYSLEVDGAVYGQGVYDTGNKVGLVKVAMASPSAVSSVTITNLSPGVQYLLDISLTQNTSNGQCQLLYNGDVGNNYSYVGFQQYGTNIQAYSGAVTQRKIQFGLATAGQNFYINANFKTQNGSTTRVTGFATNRMNEGSTGEMYTMISDTYAGGSALSYIVITTSAGTFSGTITLYKYQ